MKQESIQEQRKKRIGRNDYRRNMRANRQNNRALFFVAAAAVLFIFSAALSAQNEEHHADASVWKKECQRYFHFKEPRIVYYKDYVPTVWCSIESQKVKKGLIPFNYKKDTR